jgi:hypothetical protein
MARATQKDSLEGGGALPVVLIHLGSRRPTYVSTCADQVRHVTGHSPVVVGERTAARLRGERLRAFRSAEQLTPYGSRRFWRYACERFFVLEAVMREHGIDRCLHIESDVLLYQPIELFGEWLEETYGGAIAVCPLTDTEDTGAAVYVGSLAALAQMNIALLDLVRFGPAALTARYGGDMANEMRMLHLLRTEFGLCRALPATIAQALKLSAPCLFDPASYGQWVDGIPDRPGVPYAGDHHLIGRELLGGACEVVWDAATGTPSVRSTVNTGEQWPLATLHIHSKRLALIASRGPSSG